ncbi:MULTISPECIES: hypothetical protein [Halolamina]|uniref:Uncharacterized protein n=1 Tax=Halolamina pelagica TaxID=699431 RepID=A0A1I5VJV0_9EURY|nr:MULTISPECIES: hypothetical protein [Halolamina]NHX37640.1 hypothetical protein [Halolamina sp. R1-12]SFQ07587.1 hypothetical protein SAMN05216277_11835 [Halolamina pelagica]
MSCIEIVGAGVITIILAVVALEEHGEELTPIHGVAESTTEAVFERVWSSGSFCFHPCAETGVFAQMCELVGLLATSGCALLSLGTEDIFSTAIIATFN